MLLSLSQQQQCCTGQPPPLPARAGGGSRRRAVACRAAASAQPYNHSMFAAVTAERGFLPETEPLIRLPPGLQAYESALEELPHLALSSSLRNALLNRLPPFDLQQLTPTHDAAAAAAWQQHLQQPLPPASSTYSPQQQQQQPEPGRLALTHDALLWRAYLVLSFLTHSYMWCGGPQPPTTLPAVLARPWATVAAALDMPPVLVYATYNLMNHRRLDATGGVELGNLAVQHQFLGGVDEAWFRLVHVAIEAAAAPAIAVLALLQAAAAQRDAAAMEQQLVCVTAALQAMQALLSRMEESCDPFIYYKRVRVPMSGWRNNPALPGGLVYEGLWGNEPQQLYGETGAQSTVVPAFDAALGIRHEQGWLATYLTDMRLHMPLSHRAFLSQLEAGPCVREAVLELSGRSSSRTPGSLAPRSQPAAATALAEAYDDAVRELEAFRGQHRGFAAKFIAQWSSKDKGGSEGTGTGGSDFMPALSAYKQTTAAHRLGV